MIKISWRHAMIPACISFGPLFMTGIGGTLDGGLGEGFSLAGTFTLVLGLVLMFELIAGQQSYLEKLKAERDGELPSS